MFKKTKKIDRICKNCKLYDAKEGNCSIVVLHEGRRLKVPMSPEDSCLYETGYFDPKSNSIESFVEDVKEVKFWVENEDGEKIDGDGIVKIEYPEGFLGKEFADFSDIDEYLNGTRPIEDLD